MSAILSIQNLTKSYRVYSKPAHRLIEILSFNRCLRHKPVHALNNISLELEQGDRVGIMGENGSGKSTLLKILTGVLSPSSGQVVVRGKVAALLELGTGFNSDLTGHENVFQNGYLMGFSKQEMEERFPQILQFSELGDAINYPLKSYSSGMLMRLGFSCAVFVNPDILIVDEALSVGDGYFQTKCFYMIKSLIDKGTTFLYVSHGQDSVRTLCNKAIVLEKGRIIQSGDGHAVSDFYASYIYRKQMESNWIPTELVKEAGETKNLKAEEKGLDATDFSVSEDFARRVADLRQGSGLVRITDVIMLVNGDQPTSSVQVHDTLTLRVCFEAFAQLGPTLSLGIGICDENGLEILQCATLDEGVNLESAFEYSRHVVSFTFRNVLAPGRYSIVAGLADLTSDSTYLQHNIILAVHDVCYGALVFEVFKSQRKAIWGKVVHDFIVSATRL